MSPLPGDSLLTVARCRHAADVLDVLAGQPRTFAELRDCLRARRPGLDRALRLLAAEGAIQRHERPGTWDHHADDEVRYELTGSGRDLAGQLSDVEVWTAIYERYLYGPTS